MSAKIYRFPMQYPSGEDGMTILKREGSWWLRRQECGRIYEWPLTLDEIRKLHDLTGLVLSVS